MTNNHSHENVELAVAFSVSMPRKGAACMSEGRKKKEAGARLAKKRRKGPKI